MKNCNRKWEGKDQGANVWRSLRVSTLALDISTQGISVHMQFCLCRFLFVQSYRSEFQFWLLTNFALLTN
jgi:hypothetical protein